MVKVKSIYKKPSPDDGERIYIDPLWANGAFTEFVKIADWNQTVAPSYELWRYHYDPNRWDEYVQLYKEELKQPEKQQALQELLQKALNGTVTLVWGNGDEQHNNALVLKEVLESMMPTRKAA